MTAAHTLPKREHVMLAQPMTLAKLANLRSPLIIQPKLNGDRARIEWAGSEPAIISAYNNLFPQIPHIEEELRILSSHLPSDISPVAFDGELYKHGMRQQDIHSIVSRRVNRHPLFSQIEFHIFDYQDPEIPQITRLQLLESLFSTPSLAEQIPHIHLVKADVMLNSPEAVLRYAVATVALGYEGAIVRDCFAPYSFTRPPTMLKWKPSCKDEYRIVGYTEGEGWAVGHLGSLIVCGDDGTPFHVGSGPLFTKDQRRQLWLSRESLPGQFLLVKHEPLETATSRGIPRCAVAVSISPIRTEQTNAEEKESL